MKIHTYPVPATRDPFVNTPLIPAGFDPKTGEERFWISTWNDNTGCLGALWQFRISNGSYPPMDISLDRFDAGAPRFIGQSQIYFSGKEGLFVIKGTQKVLLCRISECRVEVLREIFTDPQIYAIFLDSNDVYGVTGKRIYIAENALIP